MPRRSRSRSPGKKRRRRSRSGSRSPKRSPRNLSPRRVSSPVGKKDRGRSPTARRSKRRDRSHSPSRSRSRDRDRNDRQAPHTFRAYNKRPSTLIGLDDTCKREPKERGRGGRRRKRRKEKERKMISEQKKRDFEEGRNLDGYQIISQRFVSRVVVVRLKYVCCPISFSADGKMSWSQS